MNAPAYTALGWQVVAVVAQKSTAVRRYIEEKGLPFNILIDSTREVSKAYGVWQRIGIDTGDLERRARQAALPEQQRTQRAVLQTPQSVEVASERAHRQHRARADPRFVAAPQHHFAHQRPLAVAQAEQALFVETRPLPALTEPLDAKLAAGQLGQVAGQRTGVEQPRPQCARQRRCAPVAPVMPADALGSCRCSGRGGQESLSKLRMKR